MTMTRQSLIDSVTLPLEMIMIRRELLKLGAWSPSNDRLLAAIPPANEYADVLPPSKTSCDLLPLVVQEAYDSVDTGKQYASFMQEVMVNPILQGLFLLALMQPHKN